MKGKKKEDIMKDAETQESPRLEESDPRKRPKPKTGGISREKYREGIEKAVEDIHG